MLPNTRRYSCISSCLSILLSCLSHAGFPRFCIEELAFGWSGDGTDSVIVDLVLQIIRHGLWFKAITNGRAYGHGTACD